MGWGLWPCCPLLAGQIPRNASGEQLRPGGLARRVCAPWVVGVAPRGPLLSLGDPQAAPALPAAPPPVPAKVQGPKVADPMAPGLTDS